MTDQQTPDQRRVLMRILAEHPASDHDYDIGRILDLTAEMKLAPEVWVTEMTANEDENLRRPIAETLVVRRDLTVHDGYEDAMRAAIATAQENS